MLSVSKMDKMDAGITSSRVFTQYIIDLRNIYMYHIINTKHFILGKVFLNYLNI